MLAGLLLGPSGIGQIEMFSKRFLTNASMHAVNTLALFGLMFFLFISSLKMDIRVINRIKRKEWAIGIVAFLVPTVLTFPMSFFLKRYAQNDQLSNYLPYIAILNSLTSLHSSTSILSEHNLLNSELAHIANGSSTISGLFAWSALLLSLYYERSKGRPNVTSLFLPLVASTIGLIIFTICVLRPIATWMIRKTPEGKPLKDIFLLIIFFMVLGCSFLSESLGLTPFFGPLLLGFVIPDGPPIGSAFADKLDCIVSEIFLPLYFLRIGNRINIYVIQPNTFWILEVIILLGLFGKLIGVMVPAMYFDMPFGDSFALGLTLCSLGIVDVHFYSRALTEKMINTEIFTTMIVSALILTGCISPVVKFLYHPSRSYRALKKRTVQHSRQNVELRILSCVYSQDDVPTILNLLEASNPNRDSPIGVYVIHLVELMGRATPLFITHKPQKSRVSHSTPPTQSDRIINAFRIFEQQNQGFVTLQSFTSISCFVTIHDDVCTIAGTRKTSIVIIPFHKQWGNEDATELTKCRNVNNKILDKAPCSVGILIDRGILTGTRSLLASWSCYRVGVIFLGGPDDREALAYAMRMADHPNVNVTVVRIIGERDKNYAALERKQDNDMINEYRLENVGSEKSLYKEEEVTDCIGTVNIIRSLENSFDLIMVGRQHPEASRLLPDLTELDLYRELGFIGDMLASSESKNSVSVLVVQQHSYGTEVRVPWSPLVT
ncbi:hypothetical protein GIB67_033293 [Kingdonia uniflora]|uniref:Cation/H+ exchanger domain-containing protein n=1 Tax=Kingdonia uniflora TaxID=39325 RepID=A0A7J7LJQ5_9MAGN|nr:hypothetical protein GIB67_033293 [Kingdonia uniflora]